MNETGRTVVIAVLGVVALALAAATLPSPVTTGEGGTGGSGGGGNGGLISLPSAAPDPPKLIEVPYLAELLLFLALLGAVLVLAYLYTNRREAFRIVVATALLLGILWLLIRFVPFGIEPKSPSSVPVGGKLAGDGNGRTQGPIASTPPSVLLMLLLGLTVLGGVVMLIRSRADSVADDGDPADESPDPTAVGRAAGRAADRIEAEATVDNGVYRAWREMTDLLAVPTPETSTPREFAAAAVDAGMAREDVDELTALFEEVRYGDARASRERERRAVTVLRRIEREYAEASE